MKKFSRCALILIIVTLIGAISGYIYESSTTTPMYTSTARVIVIPGEKNEATVRATDGGLVKDFEVVLKSSVVISAAQKTAGTSENIAQYLTVNTVPNSNILELTVTNPDQTTAKTYVDAIAKNAMKVSGIIAVESIQVLEYGSESNVSIKPGVMRNTAYITGIIAAICFVMELIFVFVINAFKDDDDSDNERDYERRFGNVIPGNYMLAYDKNVYNTHTVPEDDIDEDEKFAKAIGADVYKEELAHLGEDSEKKNKTKKQGKSEAPNITPEDDIEADIETEYDVDDESLDGEPDNSIEDDLYEDSDLYDDIEEDDFSIASRAIASIADSEVAAAKEEDMMNNTSEPEEDKMRSVSDVIGIIRK